MRTIILLSLSLLFASFVNVAQAADADADQEMAEARRLLAESRALVDRRAKLVSANMIVTQGNTSNLTTPKPKMHDRIIFVIDETTEATQTADIDLSDEVTFDWDIKSLFSLDRNEKGNIIIRPVNQKSEDGSDTTTSGSKTIDVETSTEKKSEASHNQTNTVTANLAGEVIEVLPNGQLIVEARKAVKVNNEIQTMTLIGRVDQADLNPNREVNSKNIIDLKVTFEGQGDLSNTTKPGFIYRLFNKFKPL